MSPPAPGTLGGRLAAAIDRCKAGDPLQRVDVLAPTRQVAAALRHAVAEVRPVANVEFRPVGDLVAELSGRASGDRAAPMVRSGAAPREVEREALRIAARSLTSLSGVLSHPAAIDAALGCHHELLACAAPALDRLARRGGAAADLVALSEATHAQVTGAGLVDGRSQMDAACDAVARAVPGDGTVHPTVVLAGAGRTRREQDLLDAIGAKASVEELDVRPVAGAVPGAGAGASGGSPAGGGRPVAGAGGAVAETGGDTAAGGSGSGDGGPGGPASGAALRVVRCSDPEEEVRAVVRLVAQAARNGVPLWRQAVLHPGMARYERLLRQQFAEASLPVHGVGGPRLRASAPAALLVELLDAARGGWRRERVLRWMGSAPIRRERRRADVGPVGRWDRRGDVGDVGPVGRGDRRGDVGDVGPVGRGDLGSLAGQGDRRGDVGEPGPADRWDRRGDLVPVGRWDRVAAAAGVVEGAEQWQARLAALDQELRRPPDPHGHHAVQALGETAADKTGGAGAAGGDGGAGGLPGGAGSAAGGDGGAGSALRALGRFMEELVGRVPDGPATWTAWSAWGEEVLERYLAVPPASPPAPGRAADPLDEATAAVRRVLRNLAQADELAGAPVGVTEVRHALAAAFDAVRLPHDAERAAGVEIGHLSGAAGLDVHTVYVVGLADAWFPGTGAASTLLSDADRIAAADPALPSRAETLRRRQEDWRAVLATGSAHVLFHPRTDPRTGRELAPSRWLEELGTTIEDQPSFVSGVRHGPPATEADLRLRRLVRHHDAGRPAMTDEACRSDPALVAGMEAVTARASRRVTRFDGLVGTPGGRHWADRPVSATGLQTYAECPRRFLFERELGALPPDRPEDRLTMDPATRGTLVHAILEEYVSGRLGGSPPSLGELLAIAKRHFDDAEAHGRTGATVLWEAEQEELRALLQRFFAADVFEPVAVEAAFGTAPEARGPATPDDADDPVAAAGSRRPLPAVPVRLPGGAEVRFRGTVDRVDRTPDGGLLVTDYKTGPERRLARQVLDDPVARGTRLQLPLYAAAARPLAGGLAGDNRDPGRSVGPPVRARFWMLSARRAARQAAVGGLVDEAVMERFTDVVGHIVDGVHRGVFAAAPDPFDGSFDRCQWCPFDAVCPTERDREWAAKQDDATLQPVRALRTDIDEGSADAPGFRPAPAESAP